MHYGFGIDVGGTSIKLGLFPAGRRATGEMGDSHRYPGTRAKHSAGHCPGH